ncbi:YbaK/EbsC family protein [Kiloniella laminariae]|uniref:YbaK/EbsC family protein n=1 Tax=Kiloniella laminariae TaxID=454162 RepID=A0ABT4LFL2_9PROT|nr:YbaK/EbsC family protein [Kiloniella laminariae]MCZ4279896.1 YbaK/EbsC family protein [Kiloniella laminariae]
MSRSIQRVKDAAAKLGLALAVKEMPSITHTAEQAAQACRCELGQIVKSLVFMCTETQELVLFLVAGDQQVDISAASLVVGSPLKRADPQTIRKQTGFAIGGVSPIGHKHKIPIFIAPALFDHKQVWASAGAPNAVFSITPDGLKTATQARFLTDLCCKFI